MDKKGFRIVTRPDVSATLLTVQPGTTAKVPCSIFAPYNTVLSAAWRRNKRVGCDEFTVTTPDKGATIVINRIRPAQNNKQ